MNSPVHETRQNALWVRRAARIFKQIGNDVPVAPSGGRVAFLCCVTRERQGGSEKEGTMKRLTNITTCMTTAAAALMITAGIASAQTSMKAEVPFAFSVGSKVAEPGTYQM